MNVSLYLDVDENGTLVPQEQEEMTMCESPADQALVMRVDTGVSVK